MIASMDGHDGVEISPAALTRAAESFSAQNRMMSRRVTVMSFIIGGLLVGGAVWYIGLLDPLMNAASQAPGGRGEPVTTVASVADVVRRLGAVVMMIFLVRIFVPLLRYAAELEIFYASRAAALSILAERGSSDGSLRLDVRSLLNLVSSDKIKLAAAPDSPVSELMATARGPDKAAHG
jgi:hypothetical protein